MATKIKHLISHCEMSLLHSEIRKNLDVGEEDVLRQWDQFVIGTPVNIIDMKIYRHHPMDTSDPKPYVALTVIYSV